MDGANSQQQARGYWITAYPFEPWNGGEGASLECESTSSRVALVGEGNTFVINNTGADWGHVRFGQSAVEAGAGSFGIPPGTQVTISQNAKGDAWTHVAGYSPSTTTVQITRGFGI